MLWPALTGESSPRSALDSPVRGEHIIESMSTLSIGDFARATHLSVKTLRHYHEERLLAPAEVDPHSGYRRYDVNQIPTAQIIRRFRDLGMPVADVKAVLQAPDLAARNALIARHLRRLEAELDQTQAAVSRLRDLLERPAPDLPVEHRRLPRTRAAAIIAEVTSADVGGWLQGALGELYATVSAQAIQPSGAAGGIYADSLFQDEHGTATVYLPVPADIRPIGRVAPAELPAIDLAVIAHNGPEDGIDRAYGALAAHVARHALAIDGPIRELYPVNRHHTANPEHWRTEIGWPIFATHPDTP
jgi:DNA-binding transcriptional MerR regulator/effector-binding domain-containing protein